MAALCSAAENISPCSPYYAHFRRKFVFRSALGSKIPPAGQETEIGSAHAKYTQGHTKLESEPSERTKAKCARTHQGWVGCGRTASSSTRRGCARWGAGWRRAAVANRPSWRRRPTSRQDPSRPATGAVPRPPVPPPVGSGPVVAVGAAVAGTAGTPSSSWTCRHLPCKKQHENANVNYFDWTECLGNNWSCSQEKRKTPWLLKIYVIWNLCAPFYYYCFDCVWHIMISESTYPQTQNDGGPDYLFWKKTSSGKQSENKYNVIDIRQINISFWRMHAP